MAAKSAGFTCTRIAGFCAPPTLTSPTPGICDICLNENAVRVITDGRKRQRFRGQCQHEHWRICRIGEPIDRRSWHWRQEARRRIDRRLHGLRRKINTDAAVELQCNLGAFVATARSHLRHARYLAELPFEGRCHCAGNGLRVGTWKLRGDQDRRRGDIRQSRYGQQLVTDQAQQQDCRHEQARGDRPSDECG